VTGFGHLPELAVGLATPGASGYLHDGAIMQESTCCSFHLSDHLSAELFKALGEPNRLAILARLATADGPQGVGEVAGCCDVDLSVVSRHLHVLRDAGIVEAERQGRHVRYRVKVRELVGALRGLADALEACCPDGSCTIEGHDHG